MVVVVVVRGVVDYLHQSMKLLGIKEIVAEKNHIPCSCSLLLLLDSHMAYMQVEQDRLALPHPHPHPHQASQFFTDNFCVSPLDYNGKSMSEMLHRWDRLVKKVLWKKK